MTNKNILTCPICGHNEVNIHAYHLRCITVNCVKCDYESRQAKTVQQAIKNWDKRKTVTGRSTVVNDGYKKLYIKLNRVVNNNADH